jgi:hypothetical protein
MKKIYRKTSIFSFVGGSIAAIYAIVFYFVWFKGFSVNGETLIVSGVSAISLLIAGLFFNNAQQNLRDETMAEIESDVHFEDIDELILQWMPSFYPTMHNVNAEGISLFQIIPTKRRPFARKLTAIKILSEGFILPATYDILDMKEELLASFTVWNNGNRFLLTLHSRDGKRIGYFEQWLTKSVLKNRGTLFHENDRVWRELTANNMAGDIDVVDDNGKMTAKYRFGRFPYALHPAFEAEGLHNYIRFGNHISNEEKLAYTMIFFFWLKK